ncbi:MAG: U32 family peptidase, partial [Oscillospiraceae bacterium]
VHNLAGVKALEELGAKRVVLSRELSRNNIKHIIENCNAEIEIFVHGAMCMSYSGQCLMSSALGGRSGNRGMCAQPCRLPYNYGKLKKNEKFYLSLKDMSLINHINDMKNIGVKSLKIEGRMKGAAYVGTVVKSYRRCLDEGRLPTKNEVDNLNRVFFRGGLTDGYFKDEKGVNMFAFDKPDNPYKNGEVLIDANLQNQESIKHKLKLLIYIKENEKPQVIISSEKYTVEYTGNEISEVAQKRSIIKENIINQLSKTGGTPFEFESIDVNIDGNPFISIKELNNLRRVGIEKISTKILEGLNKNKVVTKCLPELLHVEHISKIHENVRFRASVRNIQQYDEIKEFSFDKIYIPLHVLLENIEALKNDSNRIIIKPQIIIHDYEYNQYLKDLDSLYNCGFKNLCVQNIRDIDKNKDGKFNLYGGFRLNICNSLSILEYKERGFKSITLSPELKIPQIRDIRKDVDSEILAYGRLELMVTENCIIKNTNNCPCNGKSYITDRMGVDFPIIKDGNSCRSVVLNSVPTFMADKINDIKNTNIDFLTLDFTIESPEECEKITRAYILNESLNIKDYTRLHFY